MPLVFPVRLQGSLTKLLHYYKRTSETRSSKFDALPAAIHENADVSDKTILSAFVPRVDTELYWIRRRHAIRPVKNTLTDDEIFQDVKQS